MSNRKWDCLTHLSLGTFDASLCYEFQCKIMIKMDEMDEMDEIDDHRFIKVKTELATGDANTFQWSASL